MDDADPEPPKPDLMVDANVNATALTLAVLGQRKFAADKRRRELEEQARKDARAALIAANAELGAVELVRLYPAILPLMEFGKVDDRDDHTRTAPFLGVEFTFSIPGFTDVFVWVSRKCPDGQPGPWELGEFRVSMPGPDMYYADLSLALAAARDQWVQAEDMRRNVPF